MNPREQIARHVMGLGFPSTGHAMLKIAREAPFGPSYAFSGLSQVVRPESPRPAYRPANARNDLVVAFPPDKGYLGACTTVADLSRHGIYPGHLGTTPNKQAAVKLIHQANMEAMEGSGNGNEANRRLREAQK